jgi:amino acid transporter/nucleotide-binding universal stress UspA family protein
MSNATAAPGPFPPAESGMEVRLSREMRLVDITMIGVGAMIGAGIFVLTGIAAGVAGPALLLVFGLNGVVALLTAMTYAELGSAFHDAGGGYLWVKTSLPDPNGFLSGWMSWFAHAVACSLYALGFGAYFRLVLEASGVPEFHLGFMTLEKWLAVITCTGFAFINFRGASETGKAGNIVTVGKIIIIGAFIAAGLWVMNGRPQWQVSFEPFLAKGWGAVLAAMGLTFIAFEGYEIIAQTSEEVEDPKRNVPRAIFLSLLVVVPIYLLVAVVAIGAVTPPAGTAVADYLGQEKELALVSAANQFVAGGGILILVGGLLSTLSALNATIYSSSRVAFAMARDANLPTFLGDVHRLRATPHWAILFSTVLIVVMAVLLPIEEVAAAADIMFLFLFVQVNLALIRLRKQRPDLDRGFRVPLVPFVPILAMGTMVALSFFLVTHYPLGTVTAMVWVVGGAGVYYGYSRHREAAYEERGEWMDRIHRREYSVLVALSNPKAMETLMEIGMALARGHSGELVVMSVVEVPEGQALLTGRREARERAPLLEQAMKYAADRGVEARSVVKIARRVSFGIVETVREEECNFLLMGRPHAQSFFERLVANSVERVLRDAPCQVGVVYGTVRPEKIARIVVPMTGSGNARLAASLAPAFSTWFESVTLPITVVESDATERDKNTATEEATRAWETGGQSGEVQVLRRRELGTGLAHALRSGDLVLMGAPGGGHFPLVGEALAAILSRKRRNPVVAVREVEEKRVRRFERVFFSRK